MVVRWMIRVKPNGLPDLFHFKSIGWIITSTEQAFHPLPLVPAGVGPGANESICPGSNG
jgi:hypothetical protein